MNDTAQRPAPPTPPPKVAPPRSRARRSFRLLGLVLAVACAAVALRRVDLAAVGTSLAGASPAYLALAMAANVASLFFHAMRWRSVIRAPGVRVRRRDVFAALVAGFAAGIVLPARGGDLFRAHMLARRAGLSTASLLVASGLDYVVGTVAFVLFLAGFLLIAPLPAWVGHSVAILAALAAAAAAVAWVLRPRSAPREERGVAGIVARLRSGLAAVKEPRALLTGLLWGLAGWVAETAIAFFTLAALGLPATISAAILAVLAASAAAAVALAPGNAGSFELATAVALAGAGIPGSDALAFAVAFHLVHLVPVAALGALVLLRGAVAREPA